MRSASIILATIALLLLAAGLIWLGQHPDPLPRTSANQPPATKSVLRIGLVPERDIFQQRRAYRALANYLEPRLNCSIQLVTNNTYEGVLQDFHDRQIDAAFLGSLVAVLAVDRDQAKVVLKSESVFEVSTYAGVIFVTQDSPIRTLSDLRGKTVGGVPTTTAGAVFPVFLITGSGIPQTDRPRLVWTGTHDDVIREVVAGHVDAGAVKDLRLDSFEKEHPGTSFRRIASSPRVPDNALVIRNDMPADLESGLIRALLAMNEDKSGGGPEILAQLGFGRFLPASLAEYAGLYDMLDAIGAEWPAMKVAGPRPLRPAGIAPTAVPRER